MRIKQLYCQVKIQNKTVQFGSSGQNNEVHSGPDANKLSPLHKEEVAREAVEKKLEEEEEVAASSVKEGVEEGPKEGAEALVKVFLAGLSALRKNKK